MNSKFLSRKTFRRVLRYFIMFFVVFIATQFIPECKVSYQTAFILAATSTIVFAILDMYFPLALE